MTSREFLSTIVTLAVLLTSACAPSVQVAENTTPQSDSAAQATITALEAERDRLATQVASPSPSPSPSPASRAPSDPSKGLILGRVLASVPGSPNKPADGAEVSLLDDSSPNAKNAPTIAKANTTTDGAFEFDNVPPNRYRFSVTKSYASANLVPCYSAGGINTSVGIDPLSMAATQDGGVSMVGRTQSGTFLHLVSSGLKIDLKSGMTEQVIIEMGCK